MAQKHVVCRRCSRLLRPAPQGTFLDQIEYLPHTQCPTCSLDDPFIDWEQRDLREHEQEQARRWLEAAAPELDNVGFDGQVRATPTLQTTEQMRRNRLYIDSTENYSCIWSDRQKAFLTNELTTSETRRREVRSGIHKRVESIILEQISTRQDREDEKERIEIEKQMNRPTVRPLEISYGWHAPMARGPEFIADQAQKRKAELLERQLAGIQNSRQSHRWHGDLVSGLTPPEQLPYLAVAGLGNRMALDPHWTSAPPRTEPWPPGTTPARTPSPPPLIFPPRNAAVNDYPDAVAAYAPNLVSRHSRSISQQSGGNNPLPSTSAQPSQSRRAPGQSHTKSTKSKTRSPKSRTSKSKTASAAPHAARVPPDLAFTSPGNLDSNRSITNALERTRSAAPRAPMSVPNIYHSPTNRENTHSTTRALPRTASAAPAVPQSPPGFPGVGGSSRSGHRTTRSLSRAPSAAPARPSPPFSPAGHDSSPNTSPYDYEAIQAFGLMPIVNYLASAPAEPLHYVNPQALFASPASPVAASVPAPSPAVAPTPGQSAASPNDNNDNNAQGGDSSGV